MRILIIEDDPLLGDALLAGLTQAGHAVSWVQDGDVAESALDADEFAAIILDLGLPKQSGLDLLRKLRTKGCRMPVLILTARDTVQERVLGLDSGADDYLTKPFDMNELAARLRAMIRRSAGHAAPMLTVGALSLDPAGHGVTLKDRPLTLSAREFAVLHVLMQNAGRVLSRGQIEQQLYAWGQEVESNTVEVYIHHLRRKLGTSAIRTLRGVGYLLPKNGGD